MAVPQYITRLRAMTEEQRHQIFATADTPFRRLVVAEYLAREVEGDEAFDKRMSDINEELGRKSFKTSALNVLQKWGDGIRRMVFFGKED
jgi:hypothetical protein